MCGYARRSTSASTARGWWRCSAARQWQRRARRCPTIPGSANRIQLRHDPREAKRLLQAAGYGPRNPCNATVLISTSGSGQMQPLPMNEAIKQGLAEIGINLRLEVLEWETLRGRRRSGAAAPEIAACMR
ncbi:ABC transporter substrate-binding protein [Siccirubricoccus deserti]